MQIHKKHWMNLTGVEESEECVEESEEEEEG